MKLGVPVWSVVAFAAGIGLALSPNLFYLYGIHNDYEMALQAEQHHLFFTEAGDLAAIGRPVAALLSNIPMLPVGEFADFRWTRLFSLLTVCVLGAQMISISVRTLQVRTLDAVAVALATFLVPSFIYATLNATAGANSPRADRRPEYPGSATAAHTRHRACRAPSGCARPRQRGTIPAR